MKTVKTKMCGNKLHCTRKDNTLQLAFISDKIFKRGARHHTYLFSLL